MPTPLNILIVEDSQDDADLLVRELRRAAYDLKWKRVETEPDFLAELKNSPDIILSDYSMPQFSGLRAAELLRKSGLGIPFILISGTVGEDTAVEAMKMGVTDYLLKDRLARLGQAVERALLEAKERMELKQAEENLHTTHVQLRQLLEHSPVVIYSLKVEGQNLIPQIVSESMTALLGFTVQETLSYDWWFGQLHPKDRDRAVASLSETLGQGISLTEYRIRHKNGSFRWMEDKRRLVRDSSGRPNYIVGIWADITERMEAEDVLRKASQQESNRRDTRMLNEVAIVIVVTIFVFGFLFYTNILQTPLNAILKHKELFDEVIGTLAVLVLGFAALVYRQWKEFQSKNGQQQLVEQALRTLHGELETRIQQRTLELAKTNDALRAEIIERKLTEERLQEYEKVVEGSEEMMAVIDRDYRYVLANRAFLRYRGLEEDQLIGKLVPNLLNKGVFEEKVKPKIDECFQGKAVSYELRYNYPKLGERDLFISYFPIEGRSGVDRVACVLQDITERKQAQEELLWKTTFLEAQVNSALDGILVVNSQGKIILQNKRFAELFKIPAEIIGENDDAKLRNWATSRIKDPVEFSKKVEGLYSNPDEIGRDEIQLIDGTLLDRYSAPVRDKDGKYYGRIWAFRDITERRKLEAQLMQSQKMESIGQLAGGVAHDFNNILGIIQMQSGLLKGSGGLSAEQVEFANEIGATVQRAAALTRQLLLFSRREVFQPRDLDLNESIINTTKMLRRILGETVEMQLNLTSQPMFIHGDAGMLDQVLMNLAVNARDAMPKGGQLTIKTSDVKFDEATVSKCAQARPGSFVCLSISDNGCGIPPEILPKIFEPFFTTKDVGKGTGLGLATVFGIVQQHQGWINVSSEAGRGTMFQIYLPCLARKAAPKSSPSALTEMRGGNETILLVEDDPTLRFSVRKALSQLGYRILEAPTGVKAIEVWKENRNEIRLLLTDLVMPDGMTGKDLAQRLFQENSKLKAIYMSGYSAEVVGKDFQLLEGVNFLTKPFQAEKLAQTVRECLDAEPAALTNKL
jgi:PAS domain S-box-containing protein